jgi:hypothetical protein
MAIELLDKAQGGAWRALSVSGQLGAFSVRGGTAEAAA